MLLIKNRFNILKDQYFNNNSVDSFAFVHITGHPSSISEVLVICIFYILRRIGFLCKNRFKAPVGTRSRGT
jgi:hypothetical protein